MNLNKYALAAILLMNFPSLVFGAPPFEAKEEEVIVNKQSKIVVELSVQRGSLTLESYTVPTLTDAPAYISRYTTIPYISEIKNVDGKNVVVMKDLKTGWFATIRTSIPNPEVKRRNLIPDPIALDIEISDSSLTGNDWAIQEGVTHEKPETSAVTISKSLIVSNGVEMTVPANLLSISRPDKSVINEKEPYSIRIRARKI